MVDESSARDDRPTADGDIDTRLDVLGLTDEVIGLSAELTELRIKVDLALERSGAAAETAQSAEVAAVAAAEQTKSFGEYLGELTSGLGAREVGADAGVEAERLDDLASLSKEDLVARVEHLEAVLARRSVRFTLGAAKKLRGS
ncbi:MAG: hypothetical protein AB8G14_17940 [Ilumatobacter sp.]